MRFPAALLRCLQKHKYFSHWVYDCAGKEDLRTTTHIPEIIKQQCMFSPKLKLLSLKLSLKMRGYPQFSFKTHWIALSKVFFPRIVISHKKTTFVLEGAILFIYLKNAFTWANVTALLLRLCPLKLFGSVSQLKISYFGSSRVRCKMLLRCPQNSLSRTSLYVL